MAMNNDYDALLAALKSALGRDVGSKDVRMMQDNFAGGGVGRPLTEAERRARGMDPRDPNQYSIMPDGSVVGTLMGWAGMGDKLTPEQIDQMWGSKPTMPQASANQGGKYRLSPGVYGTRDEAMRRYQGDVRNWRGGSPTNWDADIMAQIAGPVAGGTPSSPMIPKATPNRFGMTRLSPGMYRDAEGKTVKSRVGAPTQKKVFDPKRTKE